MDPPQREEPLATDPPDETTPLVGMERNRCQGCCCCQTLALGLLTVCVVIMVLAAVSVVSAFSLIGYPWHASCRAEWTFGKPCPEVADAIQNQMANWTGPDGCKDGGERCLYEIVSVSSSLITGTHTTPVAHYVDELRISFVNATDTETCRMKGYSRSKTWYAYLDSGTNYCNMRNLISGAGLDKQDDLFTESTSNSQCTQYSTADCKKY